MQIKSFRAATATDALALARDSLGPEAIVLETRRIAAGVEVLAARERPSSSVAAPPPVGATSLADAARSLRDTLQFHGFSPLFAERLAAAVQASLSPQALADPVRAIDCARGLIAMLVPPIAERRCGRAETLALIGPPGVGKTTMLFKLAARERLESGRPVLLATADDQRLGGAEQVEAFAGLLGVPFRVVRDRRDIDEARAAVGDGGLVLVDTAGASRHDDAALAAIDRLLSGVRSDEIELLLAADKEGEALAESVRRFRPLRPGALGATRLDEAVRRGCLVSAVARAGLPLRHIGCGPEIPDDLELADGQRFAAWALPPECRVSTHSEQELA